MIMVIILSKDGNKMMISMQRQQLLYTRCTDIKFIHTHVHIPPMKNMDVVPILPLSRLRPMRFMVILHSTLATAKAKNHLMRSSSRLSRNSIAKN